MTNSVDVNARWPSAMDMCVRYNSPRSDRDAFGPPAKSLGVTAAKWKFVSSVLRPPAIVEHDSVREEAHREFTAFLESRKTASRDETGAEVFATAREDPRRNFKWRGEVTGQCSPIDRTLETPLMDEALWSAQLVRHLQETVLRKYPLWRIIVVANASDGEEHLAIYPDAVRFGDELARGMDHLEGLIERWRQGIDSIREPKRGPRRRQFRYVMSRVPDLIPELLQQDDPFIQVAQCDNYRGDFSHYVVWMLQKESQVVSWDTGVSGDEILSSLVTRNGCLDMSEERFKPEKGNLRLFGYLYPRAASFRLTLVGVRYNREKAKPERDGREWTVELSEEEIVTDAELQQLEQAGELPVPKVTEQV